MRKKSMKEAEAAIEETVKKWDPAKDPHIEVYSCCAMSTLHTPTSGNTLTAVRDELIGRFTVTLAAGTLVRHIVQGDPFKTLFVGRLSYDVTEKRLRREFEEYGPIKSVSIVHNIKSGALPPPYHVC